MLAIPSMRFLSVYETSELLDFFSLFCKNCLACFDSQSFCTFTAFLNPENPFSSHQTNDLIKIIQIYRSLPVGSAHSPRSPRQRFISIRPKDQYVIRSNPFPVLARPSFSTSTVTLVPRFPGTDPVFFCHAAVHGRRRLCGQT